MKLVLENFAAVKGATLENIVTTLFETQVKRLQERMTGPPHDSTALAHSSHLFQDPLTAWNSIRATLSGAGMVRLAGFLVCRDEHELIYAFELSAKPSLVYPPFRPGKGSRRHECLTVEQWEDGRTEIRRLRKGREIQRIFSEGRGERRPWVSVTGEPLSRGDGINFNRLRRGDPLLPSELQCICDDLGCIYPPTRAFLHAVREVVVVQFASIDGNVDPSTSGYRCMNDVLWTPPEWTMTDDEWASHQAATRRDDSELDAEIRRDHERWLGFKARVEVDVAVASPGARPRVVLHEGGGISTRGAKAGASAYREFNLPDEAFDWSDYEEEFKRFLLGPTAFSVTLQAVDSQGKAYLRIEVRGSKKDDRYSFNVARNGAVRLPMFLGCDRDRGIEKPFDPDLNP